MAAEAPFQRALVVRFGRIGDMLVVTPAMRALRQAAPDARIDLLTTRLGRRVFASNPHVDEVHVLGWRRVPVTVNPVRATIVARLEANAYDAVFLLESGAHYHRLVEDIGASPIYTFAGEGREAGAFNAQRGAHHEVRNFFAVLALAGIESAGIRYEYRVSAESDRAARALLAGGGIAGRSRVVGIHAGHFQKPRLGRGPHAKTWPIDRWAQLVRRLADRGADHIVLTGGQSERSLTAAIADRAGKAAVLDLAGQTSLETLAAVIRRMAVFVAPDTGPAHLAAAVDTPLVGLFGPKSPRRMGPLGDETRIIRLYPEPSSASDRERGGHHARMWAITVDDVLAAISRLGVALDRTDASGRRLAIRDIGVGHPLGLNRERDPVRRAGAVGMEGR